MPLRKFICPDKTQVTIKDCMKSCRMGTRCVSKVTLAVIRDNAREWKGLPSVTQLMNGTRMSFLQVTRDYAVEPRKQAYSLLGSAHHKLLEDQAKKELGMVPEKRLDFNGISGQLDNLSQNDDGTYTLLDYKTYGSYAVARLLGITLEERLTGEVYKRSGKNYKAGDPKRRKFPVLVSSAADNKKETFQLNAYRYIFENALGIKIRNLELQVVVRDGNTMVAKNRGVTQEIYYPIMIPIIPDHVVESVFGPKRDELVAYAERYFSGPIPPLDMEKVMPPVCNEEETWNGKRCISYCDVVEFCPEGRALRKFEQMLS